MPYNLGSAASQAGLAEIGHWSDGARARRYDSERNRVFYQGVLSRLIETVPKSLRGRGLDLGCGTGFSTERLVQTFPGLTWEAVDVSPSMLGLAASKPALGVVGLRRALAEALPYARGCFDLVVSNFSWHWFAPAAAREAMRVVRPGGWLLASVPVRRYSQAAGNRWLGKSLLASRHRLRRSSSQGLVFEDLAATLSQGACVRRAETAIIQEVFSDARVLFDTLDSRGSIQAIFGSGGPPRCDSEPQGKLSFDWSVGLFHAEVAR